VKGFFYMGFLITDSKANAATNTRA
jgi:hypothetical protein